MYKENNRKYKFTLPYSPESNGYIKNFNKQLRKMFREIFIRKNNLKWVDYLQICCDNNNTQYNRTTKNTHLIHYGILIYFIIIYKLK